MKTKFESLLETLRENLRNGTYPSGSRFPSVYELARMFDINKTTANKISIALMSEGYLARAGSSRAGLTVQSNLPFPSGKIALIGGIRHPFFADIAAGVFNEALQKNYLAVPMAPPITQLDSCLRLLEHSAFQGIVSYSYGKLDTALPVVYLETDVLNFKGIQVSSDNFKGGKRMVELLLKAGHRDILFYFGSNPEVHPTARIAGMFEAARAGGIEDLRRRTFRSVENNPHNTIQTLKNMRERFPGFSAIVTDSDDRVFMLMVAGRKLGIDIPGDISVTGFGDIANIQAISRFPTANEHPFEIGVCGCETLIRCIECGTDSVGQTTLLDVEIMNEELLNP